MKKHYLISALLLLLAAPALLASNKKDKVVIAATEGVSEPSLVRDGSKMVVGLTVDPSVIGIGQRRAVLLTPTLVNGTDSLALTPIALYSRNRWIHYDRMSRDKISGLLSKTEEMSVKAWKDKSVIEYTETVDWQDWMNEARLVVLRNDVGCCLNSYGMAEATMAQYYGPVEFCPALYYVKPDYSGPKRRELVGEAQIQFPVDKSVIYAERYRNPEELGKIRSSIESVKNDEDVTINAIALKGFASPEGAYSHNTQLAKNRTEAIRKYVSELYDFPKDLISTSSTPEDWDGLKAKMQGSGIPNEAEIIAIIDDANISDLDRKELKIRQKYPESYARMKRDLYPELRRTEYRVNFTVSDFTDPEKVREMAATQPSKLSLEEFYLASSVIPEGSQEFQDLWETAVRMYPDSETANANAAAAALSRGDLVSAERFLKKAGNAPEAEYSRGVYATLTDDYAAAEKHFLNAQKGGLDCNTALSQLELVKERGRK